MNTTNPHPLFWGITILSFILIEFFFAKLAFHTMSDIASQLYLVCIAVNIVPITLLWLQKHKHVAITLFMLIGMIIIPYQMYLGNQLLQLKEEAANITIYIHEYKLQHGQYPQDISEYDFTFSQIKDNVVYTRTSPETFHLHYHVGTESTSHFYTSDMKKWAYYPD